MELWLRIYIYIIIPTNIQSISIAIYATNQLLWTCIVLNSKAITYTDIDIDISTLTMQQNFGGYYINIPIINYLKADKLIYSIFITRWERISTYTAVWLDRLATNITIYQATNSKQGILKIRIVYKNWIVRH